MDGEYIQIKGGNPLCGRVRLHGAKNAVLPLLAAAMLTHERVTIHDCPYITDVEAMTELLCALGLLVERKGRDICVSGTPVGACAPQNLSSCMRSSMFMLGALLSRTGEVNIPMPGGCNIGARPLDIHLDGLRKMGAYTECGEDYIRCVATRLHGAQIVMRYPSVGATENLLMAAVTAKGDSTLVNCAREPEIVSLAEGLRSMGANIEGEGSSVIHVRGEEKLFGADIIPVGDRIVCGSILAAVATCGGSVDIEGVGEDKLDAVLCVLRSKNTRIVGDGCGIRIFCEGRGGGKHIVTGPYPLFPTDMQAQLLACACASNGVSVVRETVFENRFSHIRELKKMGAKIQLDANCVTIEGGNLYGANMCAADLRGGAGLVIAALAAQGVSRVYNPAFIDRGYENFEGMLCALNADVVRKTGR